MLTTVRNWFRNAGERLDLMWTEPLSWLVLVGAAVWLILELRRSGRFNVVRSIAIGGLGLWLVAALAVTVYPIGELEGPALDRFEIKNAVPFWGLIEAIANSDGYLMTQEEWELQRQRLADEMGIPVEEVNLDRKVHGPGLGVVFKDPIGNMVLFMPLGWLSALGWRRMRTAKRVWVVGVAVSGVIELSQFLFGLGSVGTIDDVIFNSLGALAGYGVWVGSQRLVPRLATI